ncbi:MAG: hypothetical protein ACKVOR_11290 [Flavobacteriales bacterium]
MKVHVIENLYTAAQAVAANGVRPDSLYRRTNTKATGEGKRVRKGKRIAMRKVVIDGMNFYYLPDQPPAWHEAAPPQALQWIYRCASLNGISPHVMYEAALSGRFNCYQVSSRFFLKTTDPEVVAFMAEWKQGKSKKKRR